MRADLKICECEKVCFDSKSEALKHALGLQKRKHVQGHVSAYRCAKSGEWHITTTAKSKLKQRTARYQETREGKYKSYKREK